MCIASEYMPGSAAVRHCTQPAGTQASARRQHYQQPVGSRTPGSQQHADSHSSAVAIGVGMGSLQSRAFLCKATRAAHQLVYLAWSRRLWASTTVSISSRCTTDAALTSLDTAAFPSSCLHMITGACHGSACVIAWQRQMYQPESQTTMQTSHDSDAAGWCLSLVSPSGQ